MITQGRMQEGDTQVSPMRSNPTYGSRTSRGGFAGLGRALERGFTILGLCVVTKAVLPFLEFGATYRLPNDVDGSKSIQAATAAVYVIAFLLLAPRIGEFLTMVRGAKMLALLVMLPVLSVAWSIDPLLSARRASAMVGTTVFAAYIVVRFDATEFIRLVGKALAMLAVASIVFVFAMPEWGLHADHHIGSVRGVFLHKNTLGITMGLGLITSLLIAMELSVGLRRFGWSAVSLLTAALVYASGSRTGWILACVGLVSVVMFRALRRRPSVGLAAMWTVALIAVVPLVLGIGDAERESPVDVTLSALDRSDSLTGRVPLWGLLTEEVGRSPWLGYGYRAYWDTRDGPVHDVHLRAGWQPNNAHNGYLDVLLDLGVLGFAILLAGYGVMLRQLVRRFSLMPTAVAAWLPAVLVLVVLGGMVESMILQRNSISWIVLAAVWLYATARPEVATQR